MCPDQTLPLQECLSTPTRPYSPTRAFQIATETLPSEPPFLEEISAPLPEKKPTAARRRRSHTDLSVSSYLLYCS